jgi:acyl carrier protein
MGSFEQLNIDMYNLESVQKKVTDIITERLGIPKSEVTLDASFVKDLGIDSLDYAELVMEFEQTFDIKIPDDDAERMNTIASAVNYIMGKIEAAKS